MKKMLCLVKVVSYKTCLLKPLYFSTTLNHPNIYPTQTQIQHIFDNFKCSSKLAFNVFLWAKKQPGFVPSVGIFNGVVKVFVKNKEFKNALSFIFDSIKKGSEYGPDFYTFVILIRRYATAGLPSPAIKTLELARSLNLVQGPNSGLDLFEILLDSFCKEGLILKASEYFKHKRTRDPCWVPSTHAYNSLLFGWFRARQLQPVNWFLDEMAKDEVKHDVVTYSILVKGFCWMSRVEVAIEFLGQMKDEGIKPNASIYDPIIHALGKLGRFKEALGMLERFQVLDSGPTFSTYDSLVKTFCKAGDIDGANKIIKMMISRGCMPTTTTYSYLLMYFLNKDMTEEGINLYSKMIESGYNPDLTCCLILVKMLCKEDRLDLAIQIMMKMKARGHEFDFSSYNVLIHLLCDTYRLEEALGELKEMIRMGFEPGYNTCEKMLIELKKHGSLQKGKELSDIVASIPQLMSLQNMYGRGEYDLRVRRRAIMGKAKAMSDALKISRNPRKFVKQRGNLKSVQE